MKRAALTICVLAAIISLFAIGATPTQALTQISSQIYCDGFTMSLTTQAPFVQMVVKVEDPPTHDIIDDINHTSAPSVISPSPGNAFTITVHFPQQLAEGTNLNIVVYGTRSGNYGSPAYVDDGRGVAIAGGPCSGLIPPAPTNGVTWFNPGDGRIDGQPADRIAVWCNTTATPPNIVVYGVGDATNGSHGFWLGTFNNADLLKAGEAGITKNAGAGNGTVSLDTDGKGDYYAAWNGGSFNATGTGIFAKTFSCQF